MSNPLIELQDYTFTAKYARWNADNKRRETWKEAVDRVRNMMLQQYAGKGIDEEINWAYDLMLKKQVLGSQRALQFGGKPAFKKNARIYNCVASYCDRPRFFQEYFWLLLCGCGAGFSVQKHHVAKLPTLQKNDSPAETFVIPDTIEGWADAVGILLSTYFSEPCDPEFREWTLKNVEFDYSLIRPKGSSLSSGVGKAPGPDGLRSSLRKIKELLDKVVSDGYMRLRPIHAYDICMHISDAVLSGGVRRSASIAVFSHDDLEMARAKTGDWFDKNPQRARSNNSALLIRKTTTRKQFETLMSHVKDFGEPGFIWADSPEFIANPCVEIGFFTYYIHNPALFKKWIDKNGYHAPIECDPADIGLRSGWQGCNLTTVNCGTVKSEEDFINRARAAAIIGTLQAGFTDMGYLGPVSRKIFEREALLGVSMTGTMENFEIVLNPEIQRKAAEAVVHTNAEIATLIGINKAARTTCLKPEGTTSCVLGTSSGVHPHHYTRYIRRVQANTDENVYKHFKEINPQACEPSVWSAGNTDDIISFPIEVPDGAKTKNQIPGTELLKIVKSTQENWVNTGKNEELCVMPWLAHNVSNTIHVQPHEWEEITDFIYDNREYFCGISLLAMSGDKDYAQAPFTAVYTSRQIVREYGEAAIWTSGLIELGLQAFDNDLWAACSFALSDDVASVVNTRGINSSAPLEAAQALVMAGQKLTFIAKMRKFANKYFDGDMRRLTYCMKDVYNWKMWSDLKESFEKVDYTNMIEEEDNTKPEEQLACTGGVCEVVYT